jgi:dihydroflavonol-4-reductase
VERSVRAIVTRSVCRRTSSARGSPSRRVRKAPRPTEPSPSAQSREAPHDGAATSTGDGGLGIHREARRPAVQGTLRALRAAAAAGVRRVVLTSSVATVQGTDLLAGKPRFDEEDWTDVTRSDVTSYDRSKTLAERAAWDFVRDSAPEIALTTINPGLVLGPALDSRYGTSLQIVERILRRDPMLPRWGLSIVDVRDVAEAHFQVLRRPGTAGERILVAGEFLWISEMAEAIQVAYPDRKVVTRTSPDGLIRLIGVFDPALRKQVVPHRGKRRDISNERARDRLGLELMDARRSVADTATYLIEDVGV